MRSCIYVGFVEHKRLKPAFHRLRYPLYFYCIDLDELAQLDSRLPLFGYNRMRPVSIHDSDYLDGAPGGIKEKVLRQLRNSNLAADVREIFLVTQPRFFGSVFNPVSFYYCYADNRELRCVVTEVNNTFGERHVYVLGGKSDGHAYPAVFQTDKAFHVSPFNDVSGSYELRFSSLQDEIDIQVDLLRDGEKVFGAQLWGKARTMTAMQMAALILRHPLMPRLTIPRIYLEAAKLFFLKKLAYHPKPIPLSPMTIRRNPPTLPQRMIFKLIEGLLKRIETGRLEVVLPDGSRRSYGKPDTATGRGRMLVNDYGFFNRVAYGGEIGLGEAYMEGLWDSDDLVGLLKFVIANRDALQQGNLILSALSRARDFRLHRKRANTLSGSRLNIAAHYDLGNDFYQLFLDESMTYSCALFRTPDDSLEQAQLNKLKSVIAKARITSNDHVLEIGCGWGGFAIEAVQSTGCRLTGITLSREQCEYARARVRQLGLESRIEILLEDYRTVQGSYDKIVSIEMLEAVGHENLGCFFDNCDRLLKPDGLVAIQVITLPDARYETHRRENSWTQKHIFPGGVVPSLTALCQAMTESSRLQVEHIENIGIHYAETLKRWRQRLLSSNDALTAMGFDRTFRRTWEYYFSLCEAQFAMRALNDLQIVLTREGNQRL
ncbi:MAG: DUF1365 family protein [Syntrophaceae bacterium]